MPEQERFVLVQIAQGGAISDPLLGKLICENGSPFVELPPGRSPSLPEKVALVERHLRLWRDASAGLPAIFGHDSILVVPT
jgi:hypothetical protein